MKITPHLAMILSCSLGPMLSGCLEATNGELVGAPSFEGGGSFLPPAQIDSMVHAPLDYGHEDASMEALEFQDVQTLEGTNDSNLGSLDADLEDVVDGSPIHRDMDVAPDLGSPEQRDGSPPWTAPRDPGLIHCDGAADMRTACRWIADCLASQSCPTASSRDQHEGFERFCLGRFRATEVNILCSGVICQDLARVTPYCQRIP